MNTAHASYRKNPSVQALGWASLTPAELRVARLVSEGLTNRAVATHLVVSPHTVDSHLRHIFIKLGISSRVALARLTVFHDQVSPLEQAVESAGPSRIRAT
ncbi:response regulator transcription factor [Streptomyces sp. NPDC014870]|uniref:response regulator transcription factor n=1 Tax=unclassified Streptomyces TaxID=2593676 RepID=UPI00342C583F